MKKAILVLFLSVLFCTVGFSESGQTLPLISVLDFEASEVSEAESKLFVDYLSGHIVDSGKYHVIDRGQRELILEELQFSQTGCTDESCQLEIGKILQAKEIIIGSLGKIGSKYIITMKLIDVETNLTLGNSSERYDSIDELIDDSENLVFRLLKIEPEVTAEEPVQNITPEEPEPVQIEKKAVEKDQKEKDFPVTENRGAALLSTVGICASGVGGYLLYNAVIFYNSTVASSWDSYNGAEAGADFETLYTTYLTNQNDFNSKFRTAWIVTGSGLLLSAIAVIMFNSSGDNAANDNAEIAFVPHPGLNNAVSLSCSISY